MALESIRLAGDGGVYMVEPEFVDCEASKDASDWNDLVRLKGVEFTRSLIRKKLQERAQRLN